MNHDQTKKWIPRIGGVTVYTHELTRASVDIVS